MKKTNLLIGIVATMILLSLNINAQTPASSPVKDYKDTAQQQKVSKPVVDKKFKLATTALFASTTYDIEATFAGKKHCPTCYESNPIMRPFIKSGRPTTYAFGFGIDTLITYNAYNMKKHHKKYWWLGPVFATGVHATA